MNTKLMILNILIMLVFFNMGIRFEKMVGNWRLQQELTKEDKRIAWEEKSLHNTMTKLLKCTYPKGIKRNE